MEEKLDEIIVLLKNIDSKLDVLVSDKQAQMLKPSYE